MIENKHICVICGEARSKSEVSVLAELRGICGHDLGYICKDCLEHIDKMKYFERIEEESDYE